MELGPLRLSEIPPSIKPEINYSDLSYNRTARNIVLESIINGINITNSKKRNQILTPDEIMDDDSKLPSYAYNKFKQHLPPEVKLLTGTPKQFCSNTKGMGGRQIRREGE
jgi:hypothetical protein